MSRRSLAVVAACLLPSVLSACANLGVTDTGFLAQRSDLAPAPFHEVWGVPDEVYEVISPVVEWSTYGAVWIDEVVYRPTDPARTTVTAEEQLALTDEFRATLARRLVDEGRFTLASGPGRGVLRLRAAITDVETQTPWVNWVMVVLLVPTSLGGIAGEFELRDAVSDERLAAFAAVREGTPFLMLECFSRFGHAGHGMWKWAGMIGDVTSAAP